MSTKKKELFSNFYYYSQLCFLICLSFSTYAMHGSKFTTEQNKTLLEIDFDLSCDQCLSPSLLESSEYELICNCFSYLSLISINACYS